MMSQSSSLRQRAVRMAVRASFAAAALVAHAAHAEVITVNFSGNPLSFVPFSIDGVYLNLGTGAATGSASVGYDINPYFTGTGGSSPGFRFYVPSTGGMIGSGGAATQLALGTVIGASSTFASGGAIFNANSATTDVHYFGFRFINDTTNATNYAYIAVQQLANPPVAGSVQILGYAYENTGASLAVTAVPEPSSALMLLGGLLAAGALRRRKAQAS
jgi:hypothetical protein